MEVAGQQDRSVHQRLLPGPHERGELGVHLIARHVLAPSRSVPS